MNVHDSRLGTDTPGPGESVFAIRFDGKPQCFRKTDKYYYILLIFLLYAHIEVLVTFLLVDFFGFLVITRHHAILGGCH